MRAHEYSVDRQVYMKPTPEAVAKLVADKGIEACEERWHWMGSRDLNTLATIGRARLTGEGPKPGGRVSSLSDMDRAVAVEASFVLDSGARGARAAGLSHNAERGCFDLRGLDYVRSSYQERGRVTAMGAAANNGDPAAIAQRDARLAFELSVGSVLRKALALVLHQPVTGRYRLPERDAALMEVLAGEDPVAIDAVFPPPATEPVAEPEPSPDIEIQEPVMLMKTPTFSRKRKVPDDVVLVADHATGRSMTDLAGHYGVSAPALYNHWRRLGLGTTQVQHPTESEPAPDQDVAEEVLEIAQLPAPFQHDEHPARGTSSRLDLDDLRLAVDLSRLCGLAAAEALAWVRLDRDARS